MHMRFIIFTSFFLFAQSLFSQTAPNLLSLSQEFWEWRIRSQPATSDDIPRVERPNGWRPNFSPEALENQRSTANTFLGRLKSLQHDRWTKADSVDFLSLKSMMSRVNWELNVLKQPHRNPNFWLDQTYGVLYEQLLINNPIDDMRLAHIIKILRSIPKTLEHAKSNLTEATLPFTVVALDNIGESQTIMDVVFTELSKDLPPKKRFALLKATDEAARSMLEFKNWLLRSQSSLTDSFSIGKENYTYFLKNIALIPYSPETLLELGRSEFHRAATFEAIEKNRNKALPNLLSFSDINSQIETAKTDELAIRQFLVDQKLFSIPDDLKHYENLPIPKQISSLLHMGDTNDLTSENRLNENAVSYIPEPESAKSYFDNSRALDPRPIIVHEGIPGHYFQKALSWINDRPIRRRFVDSAANEGIAFYVEEMLLNAGLFDDQPKTREIIYNFMRLRALRVEVDIQLALGNFTIDQAAQYLARTVPMDFETAKYEAAFFAMNPGQAISYQIGKLQIQQFLSDAKIQSSENFNLLNFHDFLVKNGNTPIALLRWELLDLDDQVMQFFKD